MHSFHRSFDSLEDFADVISEQLHCPVTIEDANHHLLAYSSHDGETDEARIATIIGRRVPERVINLLWKTGIIPALHDSDDAVWVETIPEIGLGRRAACAVRRDGDVLGYIWVVAGEKKLTHEDLALLAQAADKASEELLPLIRRRMRRERSHEELLWQLITSRPDSHASAAALLAGTGLRQDVPLAVLVFRLNEPTEEKHTMLSYAARTTEQLQVMIETRDLRENEVLFLVSPPEETDAAGAVRDFTDTIVTRMPDPSGVWAGCGRWCTDYTELLDSFNEARQTASMKQAHPELTKGVSFFHELGLLRYVPQVKKEPSLPVTLFRLREYDKYQQTDLLQTLLVFLTNDGKMNQTAGDLHIHVNTLTYRLRRAEEVGGFSLQNASQKAALLFDFILYRDSLW
ncbi:PucR family transcriptional regulator [Alkalicoccus urumqiensis]|nr:helix-turn-helix domain-containing protein [Alkalicoccus urumqiensis]